MIDANYELLMLKLSYFLETFAFALAGKFHLISAYILFHHTTLPFWVWLSLNYNPGGHFLMLIVINLVTHLTFKTYLITTLWPSMKKIWPGNLIKKAQIVQFSLMFLHGCQLFVDNPCKYPLSVVCFGIVWGVVLVSFFINAQDAQGKNRVIKSVRNSTKCLVNI